MEIMNNMTQEDITERKRIGDIVKELQNNNLCPSCCKQTPYHDKTLRTVYEDEVLSCFFEEYPRNPGHMIVLINKHYEDISEMPIEISGNIFKIIKVLIEGLKKYLNVEKVYMCTMCDGKRNHLYFQLIPRYKDDIIRGSKLFVKERGIYIHSEELIKEFRQFIKES